jgi:uncharacterized protein YjbI with pentapeptide repeats
MPGSNLLSYMRMKIAPPKLPEMLFEAKTILSDDVAIEASKLTNANLRGRVVKSVSLVEVILEKVILAEATLQKAVGLDVIFKECDFSAVKSAGLSLQRASVTASRLMGADCSRGLFRDVTFIGCKIDLANFRFAKFAKVRFVDCTLIDADFLGAELTEVVFENCVLEHCNFTKCKMKHVDLRSSDVSGLQGWKDLQGVTIDSVQLTAAAPYLANELGIVVRD